ncbi:hypothetical protein PIIN_01270 [Serendipita indica DSM 11827]|uniref:Uncharacterized protein n=1 Tax=Serendipita indica (strain DSM 11827) TaxID=1109443 RepID=G4T7Y7_SERID|nr:hypothetical protein PIIN_01270 [Serendipita indica DSM 11827]
MTSLRRNSQRTLEPHERAILRTHLSIWKLSAINASDPTAYPTQKRTVFNTGHTQRRLGRQPTNNELNKEEENVNNEQNLDLSRARRHSGKRSTDEVDAKALPSTVNHCTWA